MVGVPSPRTWRLWSLVAIMTGLVCSFAEQPTTPLPTTSKSLVREFEELLSDTTTPTNFPGAETYIYRDLRPEPLRLFVVKPDGWRMNDHRPAMIYFFGGAWTRGNPNKSIGWARMVARWGMVGIAPDYRTNDRFGTSPVEAVADARSSARWVEDHAAELGVDTNEIVVGGASAGGHLALWTAIAKAPFGSKPEESPRIKPAALVLISAPGDTTPDAWSNDPKKIERFGSHIGDVSPLQNLDPKMPPVIMFHGDADPTVPYRIAVALHDKLIATSNTCEFTTIPGGGHGIPQDWKDKSRDMIREFLKEQHILPVASK
jgi:acetyl esterase